jgi:hypothetical protein
MLASVGLSKLLTPVAKVEAIIEREKVEDDRARGGG